MIIVCIYNNIVMNVLDLAFEWSEEGGVWVFGGLVYFIEELFDEVCDVNFYLGFYWLL